MPDTQAARDWSYKREGKEHVFMGPSGETFSLRPEGRTDTDTVLIRGVCAARPVITISVECQHALDAGLDHEELYWGEDRIETWTGAVVVREDKSGFVHVRSACGGDAFEIVEHLADNSEKVLATVRRAEVGAGRYTCYWIPFLREHGSTIEYYNETQQSWVSIETAVAA